MTRSWLSLRLGLLAVLASPSAALAQPVGEYGLDLPADELELSEALLASVGAISNIGAFVNTCPTSDPVYGQIRSDFELRRNGVVVGSVACSEPVSAMPTSQYTDELIVLQGLRVIYYMDLGNPGRLSWTPGTLYSWMKSQIGGIDIRDGSGSFCCLTYGDRLFIGVGAQNDFNREFDKSWRGISGNIGLYAHEARHVGGYFHVSCCGIGGGCDQQYEEANPSAYGVQYQLERAWLNGDINVGFACLAEPELTETVNWHAGSIKGFRERFCTDLPPVVPLPSEPGGACPASAGCVPGPTTLCLNGGRFKIEGTWQTSQGGTGAAQAVPLTSDTGYFWFFSSTNVEVVIKVLDGCGLNDNYWVFIAGLTDTRVDLTVTDTQHDTMKTYTNPLGTRFAPVQDTSAFATCP